MGTENSSKKFSSHAQVWWSVEYCIGSGVVCGERGGSCEAESSVVTSDESRNRIHGPPPAAFSARRPRASLSAGHAPLPRRLGLTASGACSAIATLAAQVYDEEPTGAGSFGLILSVARNTILGMIHHDRVG